MPLNGTPAHYNNASPAGSPYSIGVLTTTAPAQLFLAILLNGSAVTGVTGGGLTWTRRATAGSNPIDLWTAKATASASSLSVSVATSGADTFITACLFGWSGEDTSSIFDGNAAVPATGIADPVTISTTNANDVILVCSRQSSTAAPAAGSGFTTIDSGDFLLVEYQVVSAAQTNLSCTQGSPGTSNGMIADALMLVAGPTDPFPAGYGHPDGYSGQSQMQQLLAR